ncbi:eIF1-like protein [Rozella allomycis CSF55]|uniref:Translation initiation factor SUI1 domain-containing protein n=1 Tax=Rozella allomycis (strain CSF55) TaxID=988480 RepID=A0A075APV1_ROZAC|nr:Translation initiation factor SUI1 domain-containing protein [Rozella allomycis CSF55]RKP18530.1 eIF1-like protein [Rozella allomycis CSF55]|eukprot:EPZ32201.1 Translation initiation factor SUI1 domain-containing protein [Rozella allomycis CSF55]
MQTVQNYDIRIQQRSSKKTITSVQGIPATVDQKNLLKMFRKSFACNGSIVDDEKLGPVIQLQGDHRQKIFDFLVEQKLSSKESIKIHGF